MSGGYMIRLPCHIYGNKGEGLLRVENLKPVCGRDFCENCGTAWLVMVTNRVTMVG
jgi:hypothetical protein